jgi:chloramphenicol-sensitive protein RarD
MKPNAKTTPKGASNSVAADVDRETMSARAGVAYGLAAYGAWGLAPVYFKAVASVPALEVLAHRVVWSVAILVALMFFRGQWRVAIQALRHRQTHLILIATTLLIATNWYLFIWSVEHNLVLQASLGYFINPLVNVLLGVVFLRERLSRWATISVALAAVAVAIQAVQGAGIPYIALALAFMFGIYGLLRKVVKIKAVPGLAVETMMLFPPAVGYLVWLGMQDSGQFLARSWSFDVLLIFAGFMTTLPLIWFTKAARRLPLSTMGFMQYIAPSLHFLLAVLAYGEAFTYHHAITFGCIWIALGIYSVDAMRRAALGRAALASRGAAAN